MKDYRTWWRKGMEVYDALFEAYFYRDSFLYLNETSVIDQDCIFEQLWAEREIL